MNTPLIARLVSLRPLRRAGAGALSGFLVCLGLTWGLRVLHVLAPLDNLGLFVLDLETALGWALCVSGVFAATESGLVRHAVLLAFVAMLIGLSVAVNRSSQQDPSYLRAVLRPMLASLFVLGPAAVGLGRRFERTWSQGETA